MFVSFRVAQLSLLVVVLGMTASAHAATIYNATADYSTVVNTPTSTWSYRHATSHGGTYALMDSPPGVAPEGPLTWNPGPDAAMNATWNLTSAGVIPWISKNQTGVSQQYPVAPTLVVPAGALWVHPDSGEAAVISWLADTTGVATIKFRFADLHPVGTPGTGIRYFVDRNAGAGADGLATAVVLDSGDSGLITLNDVAVTAGDRINFYVELEAGLNSNATLVQATITFFDPLAVPEPATLAMTAFGALSLLIGRRRHQRAG